MVKLDLLRSVVLFSRFSEEMLKKLAEKAIVRKVKAGEILFNEGDQAEDLFSVLEGKVALEIEKAPGNFVRIKDIIPCRSFGISSLVSDEAKKCMTNARTSVDSKLIKWNAADLEQIFHQDPELGYLFQKGIARVLKDRLYIKNVQLANVA